jgi:hypothetical protein
MSTEGIDCTLFVEDFTGVSTAPSALLDEQWKCRKCGRLAADHPHGQHDGELRCCFVFLYSNVASNTKILYFKKLSVRILLYLTIPPFL